MDFGAYVADRRTKLVRTAVLLGCPRADAEDVVQTAPLRCYRSWRRVSRADHPDAHVHRVLVTTLADARARRWNGEVPTEALPEPDPGDDSAWSTGVAVRQALAAASPEHREVLVLRFFADLSKARHRGRARRRARHGQVPDRPRPQGAHPARGGTLMSTEPLEDDALRLLAAAAATIDVDDSAPMASGGPARAVELWIDEAGVIYAVRQSVRPGTDLTPPYLRSRAASPATSSHQGCYFVPATVQLRADVEVASTDITTALT